MSVPVSIRTALAACLVLATPVSWAGVLPVPQDAKVVDQRPAVEQERVYPMGPLRKISGRLRALHPAAPHAGVAFHQHIQRNRRLGHAC